MEHTSPNTLSPKKLAALLAVLAALMPFATDMYLPAIPIMADALSANIHRIEQSLSSFLFGCAIGQLLGGALSDLKGRRSIALLGAIIYLIASIIMMRTDSIDALLFWRMVQAAGAGIATVTIGATVRDFFQGREAAKMFTTIGIIMMAAPLAAPMLGAILLEQFGGWRSIFAFLAAYGVLVCVLLWRFMPQKPFTPQPLNYHVFADIVRNFAQVFRQPEALGFLFMQAFCFSSMFVFLTESSFVYMEHYGLNPRQYAWAFGANIITMMLFNRITAYRLRTTDAKNILLSGVAIQFICNLCLAVAVWTWHLPPFFIILIFMMFSVGSAGLISSNAMACYMGYFHKGGGSANAVLGVSQFVIAAGVGWLTTYLHNGTAYVMPSMMLASTLFGIALLWLLSRRAWQN
ncbi:multidrug effflux MFS transporter [Stenoxybacter acetivorans]|uniref:multidrug effflux MFS transporter n=1 Tax=Stenoxybacter acetivorans TaxID=422441 RepID=UPI00056A6E08|nr:multidrug effflux MFS transporter [Stenoxybacter acetivorans]